MKQFTKQELIDALLDIRSRGFIESGRQGNSGGIGNTLEDLLGITENNLPIPNAAEWELKTQRLKTSSLTTLFHMEPSPRAFKFVPTRLLPLYGWEHADAGGHYPASERSFRQTINGAKPTDRGFKLVVDDEQQRLTVSFDAASVDKRHQAWLDQVEAVAGLADLDPKPYWGFDDLRHKAGTKLLNCFYVQADERKEGGKSFFHYTNIMMLSSFDLDKFLHGIRIGMILVDFDARTGHNHGTKFRVRQAFFPELYANKAIF